MEYIYTGTIITVNIEIGKHIIINFDCTIGRNIIIEDYITILPSVNFSENTATKKYTILRAGTIVIRDIENNITKIVKKGI